MTRPLDRHLDADELDALVTPQALSVSVTAQLSEQALREAQRHAKSCQDCDRKVQMHRSAQSAISLRAMSGRAAKDSNCSDEAEWLRVAGGLLDETDARERMNHAAKCGRCGPLLKAAVKSLSDETTSDEEEALNKLGSARPAWQAQMAQTLRNAGEPQRPRESAPALSKGLFHRLRPAFAAAALAALIMAVWIGVRTLPRPTSVAQMLAQAYSERRTIEVRIPGAKYAPLRVERNVTVSNFDKPEPLLKAEALISERLRQHPNDPVWLQDKARADMLDGSYDDAIKALQQALESQPDSPALLTDLGSAYFLRAKSTNRTIDYSNAIDLLGKALAKDADDPIALFNRALACEEMFLYTQALDDWEHYLRVDPQGEWAGEARERLKDLQDRLNQHKQSMAEPLLTPVQIAKANTHGTDIRHRLDRRIEEYLALASTEWLPRAYPLPQSQNPEVDDFRSALHILAGIASKNHGDRWLEELLSTASSATFSKAVEHLARAVEANNAGNNVLGLSHSREAERLFRSIDNFAGVSRAEVESLFASHDAQDATACIQLVNSGDARLAAHSYRWLAIQFHIEEGTCYALAGNLATTRRLYQQAAREANRSEYPVIYLRTQDHLSTLDGRDGDIAEGWARTEHGLRMFWSGSYPAMRGYNFYFNLHEFARILGQHNLQVAAWRDGVALSDTFSDYVIRAMAHSLMGSAAVAAEQRSTAKKEFELSSELFAQAPQIKSTRIAHIEAETRLAEVETAEGNAESAVTRLRQYVPEVDQLSDSILGILFKTSLGNAEAAAGNYQSAESALHSAIQLSELHLQSIHDDRSRMEWAQRTANTYRYFAQICLQRGDFRGSLEAWEWYRGTALRSGESSSDSDSSRTTDPEHLQKVVEALPKLTHITYVSYALLPGGLAIWVYDDRGVFGQWVQGNPVIISSKAKQFRTLCADFRSDMINVQKSARTLYEALVAPIESHLSTDRVLAIELDDGISDLPFDALLDSKDRYFGDRYTAISSLGIYYQPNAQRTLAVQAEDAALVVAVPTSHASTGDTTPPLTDATTEGEIVARSFKNARLITQSDASVGSVLAELPNAQVFHFAGHAVNSPVRSGLKLFDNLLNSASIRTIAMPRLKLAVFSACDTEGSASGGIDSTDGLVRAFLRAGAVRVVASRWNVDSRVTREFMALFYKALLAGNTVAGSIHEAQSAVRTRLGLTHPYYWSAFTAFGAT